MQLCLQRRKVAFEGMTEGILITAADGTIVTVNRAFCELTGFSRDDTLGQSEKAIRNALQPPEYYDDVYATSVRAVREANGPITHFVIVASEVGLQRQGIDISHPGLRV